MVIMREGNASMYLGSPRMAEMVIGEQVTLEQMGGARMHTGVSGCAHQLVESDEEGSSWPGATSPTCPPPGAISRRSLSRRAHASHERDRRADPRR